MKFSHGSQPKTKNLKPKVGIGYALKSLYCNLPTLWFPLWILIFPIQLFFITFLKSVHIQVYCSQQHVAAVIRLKLGSRKNKDWLENKSCVLLSPELHNIVVLPQSKHPVLYYRALSGMWFIFLGCLDSTDNFKTS